MTRLVALAASSLCVLATTTATATAAVDYTSTDYTTAVGPFDPELADLDGQHGPDLVYADSASSVQYMLNDGTGHFGSPTTLALTDVGIGSPTVGKCRFGAVPQVELGETNNDSFIDIVTGCEQTFLGNGDGTFDAPFPTGSFSRGFIEFDLAKIDGTTLPDIATACGSQSGNQLLAYQSNSGDAFGDFGGVKCIQDPNTLGFKAISKEVEVYNLGNDDHTDLVTLDSAGSQLVDFVFDPSMYPQSFYGPPATGSTRDTNGTNGQAVETGDLDDDSDADIVFAMQGPPAKLSVFEQKSEGIPQGESGELNPGLTGVTELSLADVDGDGTPDAVSANTLGNLAVQIGNGDTTFDDTQGFAVPTGTSGLATGDLNGDGRADAVVTSDTGAKATVLLSQAPTDTEAPATTIGKIKVKKDTAKVSFSATDDVDSPSDITFGCGLDGKEVKPCTSPKTYKKLDKGRHRIAIHAEDTAGNIGAFDKKGFKVGK